MQFLVMKSFVVYIHIDGYDDSLKDINFTTLKDGNLVDIGFNDLSTDNLIELNRRSMILARACTYEIYNRKDPRKDVITDDDLPF